MTGVAVLRLVAVLSTAAAMAGGFAHRFALPNKIGMGREAYCGGREPLLRGAGVAHALPADGQRLTPRHAGREAS